MKEAKFGLVELMRKQQDSLSREYSKTLLAINKAKTAKRESELGRKSWKIRSEWEQLESWICRETGKEPKALPLLGEE